MGTALKDAEEQITSADEVMPSEVSIPNCKIWEPVLKNQRIPKQQYISAKEIAISRKDGFQRTQKTIRDHSREVCPQYSGGVISPVIADLHLSSSSLPQWWNPRPFCRQMKMTLIYELSAQTGVAWWFSSSPSSPHKHHLQPWASLASSFGSSPSSLATLYIRLHALLLSLFLLFRCVFKCCPAPGNFPLAMRIIWLLWPAGKVT